MNEWVGGWVGGWVGYLAEQFKRTISEDPVLRALGRNVPIRMEELGVFGNEEDVDEVVDVPVRGWMGEEVGGWVGEIEAVGMRCCGRWVGGWVGRYVWKKSLGVFGEVFDVPGRGGWVVGDLDR